MVDSLLPDVVAAVRDMLRSQDPKTVLQGIELWEGLQQKSFQHSTEGLRIAGEEKQALLKHMLAMSAVGSGGVSVNAEGDYYTKAIESG